MSFRPDPKDVIAQQTFKTCHKITHTLHFLEYKFPFLEFRNAYLTVYESSSFSARIAAWCNCVTLNTLELPSYT
jgi:hypothetical protein